MENIGFYFLNRVRKSRSWEFKNPSKSTNVLMYSAFKNWAFLAEIFCWKSIFQTFFWVCNKKANSHDPPRRAPKAQKFLRLWFRSEDFYPLTTLIFTQSVVPIRYWKLDYLTFSHVWLYFQKSKMLTVFSSFYGKKVEQHVNTLCCELLPAKPNYRWPL